MAREKFYYFTHNQLAETHQGNRMHLLDKRELSL